MKKLRSGMITHSQASCDLFMQTCDDIERKTAASRAIA